MYNHQFNSPTKQKGTTFGDYMTNRVTRREKGASSGTRVLNLKNSVLDRIYKIF
jgi:hypothetical protein